ncbi:MAG: hypothetical protein M3O30_14010 [Planctomycetota bacterium]|nr:hypothetical protein [Planctomycetota bacterium]
MGIFLCCSIWGKTGDILGDFGNDQYISWQVSQGKVLFRDVACVYGPLSPNINALVIRAAGPQLNVMLAANLGVLVLATILLYLPLRAISGTFTALTATIFFLCVFALSSPTKITNYNFLTPYSHQITHGFLLTLGAIGFLYRFQQRGSTVSVVLGGLLTGLAFLTKPEIFLGCVMAFFLGLFAILWVNRKKSAVGVVMTAVGCMLVPPLCFLIFYAIQMPFHTALEGVLGGWQFVGKPFVVSTPFYKEGFGTDKPLRNLILMFQYAGCYAAFAAVLVGFSVVSNKLVKANRWAIPAVGVLVGTASFFLVTRVGVHFHSFWPDAARGFPLFALFALALSALRMTKARAEGQGQHQAVIQWTLSILSLVFLAKMFLNVRMYQYGFVLCAPCATLVIVALVDWLPDWSQRMGGSGLVVWLGAMGILAAFIGENVTLTRLNLGERTLPIPLALGGTAWCRPLESASVDAIRWLSATSATAAVIPDAAGINYAAGRPSSIPFTEMLPMALAMFGEQNVINAFDRHPPDYILVMHVPEDAFGAHDFGRDYGMRLTSWISSNYRRVGRFGTGSRPIDLWSLGLPRPSGNLTSHAPVRPQMLDPSLAL